MPHKDIKKRQQYHKKYYQRNKLKLQNRAHSWYKTHKKRHRTAVDIWRHKNFEYQLLVRARYSAKARHLKFNLTLEDIKIPEYCPYLGIKLTRHINGGRQDTNASLDRIDNTKGYTKDNIRVISSKANFMKRNASLEELRIFAQNILTLH